MLNERCYTRRALWICLLILSPFVVAEDAAMSEDALFTEASALTPDQLEEANGRQGVPFQWQVNDTEQNATVSDNVLSGTVVTGNNTISDHAFENMSGVATVIQNTGNHVVIQDSTQINVLINQ